MKRLATIWLAMLVLMASIGIGCSHIAKTETPLPAPTKYIGQVPQTLPVEAQLIGKGETAVPFYFYVTPGAKAQLDAGRLDIDYFLMTASYGEDGKILNESHGPIPGENIIQVINICLEYAFKAYSMPGEVAWLLYVDVYPEQFKGIEKV